MEASPKHRSRFSSWSSPWTLMLLVVAVCAIVLLASNDWRGNGELIGGDQDDRKMALMEATGQDDAYGDGAADENNMMMNMGDDIEEDEDEDADSSMDLGILSSRAEEYLSMNSLKKAKTEEEARGILSEQLKEMDEDGELLEELVSEWKLSLESGVAADSQSRYYVNKPVSPRFGGNRGRQYVFFKPGRVITQACVRSGSLIDAIKVRYSDGTWSRLRGGRGGKYHCTRMPGRCISSVFLKTGALVDGILFAKKSGAISPYFGGYGGKGSAVSNSGACLSKIVLKVRSYARRRAYVESLQFFFGKPRAACAQQNVAYRRPTAQSSSGWGGSSSRAVDGNLNGIYKAKSCTHTKKEKFPWLYVDIGRRPPVCAVRIFNRRDCCAERLNNFVVFVTNRKPGKGFRVRGNEVCNRYNSKKKLTTRHFRCRKPMRGRYVGVQILGTQYLTICEFQVYTIGKPLPPPPRRCRGKRNVALRRPAYQKSIGWGGDPRRAVDGNANPIYSKRSCSHTLKNVNPWWYVNIGNQRPVCRVQIVNRKDCCGNRLNNFKVFVTNRKPGGNFVARPSETCYFFKSNRPWLSKTLVCKRPLKGRYVGVQIVGRQYLTICEFRVYTV